MTREYFGIASLTGRRTTNQDAYFVCREKRIVVAGLFDGHGDGEASALAADILKRSLGKNRYPQPTTVNKAFARANKRLAQEEGGTTATIVILDKKKKRLLCAWVGDTRAALIGKKGEFVRLTTDHRLSNRQEATRVVRVGGWAMLSSNYVIDRQGNGLMVTRALGDHSFTEVGVICEPEITERKIMPGDKFLLLYCDGLWEVMGEEEISKIVLERKGGLRAKANKITRQALKKGSRDNVSVVIVKIIGK